MIGAGWAGLAAAARLAAAGCAVTLLERRARPGGRAFSFPDPGGGPPLDNGQHVLIGCCHRFSALLAGIGLPDAVRFQPALHVPVHGDGRWGALGSARLPGPFHLLPAVLRYRHLTVGERMGALRAAAALAMGPPLPRGPDGTFDAWLRGHGCGPRATTRLWNPIGVALLNAQADQASAAQATTALRTGFMRGWRAATLGLFTTPLGEAADQALAALRALGVDVRLRTAAAGLEGVGAGGGIRAIRLASGERLPASACLAAVPPDALGSLLPPGWRTHPVFAGAARLRWSPIFNLYLYYDRVVMDQELAALLEGDLPFVFNRGRLLGRPELDGRLLGVSVSAAGHLAGLGLDEITRRLHDQLGRALPRAAGARLLRAVPVWQRHATFLPEPGSAAWRAPAESPWPGLYLAGDWTATGWPACLEGAVRSGGEAAGRLLGARAAVQAPVVAQGPA